MDALARSKVEDMLVLLVLFLPAGAEDPAFRRSGSRAISLTTCGVPVAILGKSVPSTDRTIPVPLPVVREDSPGVLGTL